MNLYKGVKQNRNNKNLEIMRTLKNTLGTILMTALLLTSCNKNDDEQEFLDIPATAEEFQNLKIEAINKRT